MSKGKVLVLHGPNLNLLGSRQPEIYGYTTLDDAIHAARLDGTQAIIINPAAYTHTSVAILDALNAFDGTVIEVHLSNVHKREAFRHHSYVSLRADGVIAGLGVQGYKAALEAVMVTTN